MKALWNIYLINRGETPTLFAEHCTEEIAKAWAAHALDKALDGSDADGFLVMRSDFPVPDIWPDKD